MPHFKPPESLAWVVFKTLTAVSASILAPLSGEKDSSGCGSPATSQWACLDLPFSLLLICLPSSPLCSSLQSPAKFCAASRPSHLLQGASCFCSNHTSLERPSLTTSCSTLAPCLAFFSPWRLVYLALVFHDRCFVCVLLECKQVW